LTIEDSLGINWPVDRFTQVDPSNLSTPTYLTSGSRGIPDRFGNHFLFIEGLKGFRVEVDKVLDPMIPITYGSSVFLTPEGVINLYEETTDCLLTEIQDNG